jgi:Ca-activated chloride channel family protein
MIGFKSPWLLFGLLVLAVAVGIWLLAERRKQRYPVRYTNVEVLATVMTGRSWLRLVPPALVLLALTCLLVGLARPQVERQLLKEHATVILVVDTSRSMQAKDVAPTRLGAAQEAIRTFLDHAPKGLRVGLVVFAGEAQVATPPTKDHRLVEDSVDQIDQYLIYGGTAIGDALQTAVELGKQVTGPEGTGPVTLGAPRSTDRTLAQAAPPATASECYDKSPVSILFLSDGSQTRGVLQPLEGAALAKRACFPVYTVALGTPDGTIAGGGFGGFPGSQDSDQLIPVPPDPDTLRAIAKTTGGEFTEARSAGTLERAYRNLGSRLGREPGHSEITWLFLALAAGLLLLAGAFATLVTPRLP